MIIGNLKRAGLQIDKHEFQLQLTSHELKLIVHSLHLSVIKLKEYYPSPLDNHQAISQLNNIIDKMEGVV